MYRSEKEAIVSKMQESLDRAAGVLLLDFTGLTVEEANLFRRKLQADSIDYVVVKNTLFARAVADKPYAEVASVLKGTPTGVVLGYDDPVVPAKLLDEFKRTCEHLRIKAGIIDQKYVTEAQAQDLAKMPTKGQMQAGLVSIALSPGRKLAAQLKSPAGRIVGAIEKLIEKLEGNPEAA